MKRPKLARWRAKRWKAEYDRMVALSVVGRSNRQIADETGYCYEHVSVILNLPQAEELRLKLQERLREKTLEDVPAVLGRAAQKAVQRIEQVMSDDDLFEKSPFQVIDRGVELLKGLRHLAPAASAASNPGIVATGPVIVMPGPVAENIQHGLQRANEALRIASASSGD